MALSPRAVFDSRIRCDSEADSIVWMGEDGGSAAFWKKGFQTFLYQAKFLKPRFYIIERFFYWLEKEPFRFSSKM